VFCLLKSRNQPDDNGENQQNPAELVSRLKVMGHGRQTEDDAGIEEDELTGLVPDATLQRCYCRGQQYP
jgi:hypothetical protein